MDPPVHLGAHILESEIDREKVAEMQEWMDVNRDCVPLEDLPPACSPGLCALAL